MARYKADRELITARRSRTVVLGQAQYSDARDRPRCGYARAKQLCYSRARK